MKKESRSMNQPNTNHWSLSQIPVVIEEKLKNLSKTSMRQLGLGVLGVCILISSFLFVYHLGQHNLELYITECLTKPYIQGESTSAIEQAQNMVLNRMNDNARSTGNLLGVLKICMALITLVVASSIALGFVEFRRSHKEKDQLTEALTKAKENFKEMMSELGKNKQDSLKGFLLLKAKIYYYQKDFSKCRTVLKSMPDQDDPEVIFSLGAVAINQFKYNKAISLFHEARVKGYPYLADIYCHIGYALMMDEKYDEALEKFKAALKEHHEHPETLLFMSYCQKRMNGKVIPEMISNLEVIIKNDPANALALYNLACYHALLSEWEESKECLERSIEVHPPFKWVAWSDEDFDSCKTQKWFIDLLQPNNCPSNK